MENYDSTKETLLHARRLNQLMAEAVSILLQNVSKHDQTKIEEPEKQLFDEYTPKLKGCTYGSEEYKKYLEELKPALEHHYAKNTHHPEHYPNGVDGMDLFDVFEMFFDWKAASERHSDGNINKSIDHNKTRFHLSDQLESIFKNTVRRMGW